MGGFVVTGGGWTTTYCAGTRFILHGRIGVIDEVLGTHVRVRFHDEVLNVSRRDEAAEIETIEWTEFIGPTASAVLMDKGTAKVWKSYQPFNQRRTAARLALVNLVATGCRSGHEGIVEEGEPVEELRNGGRTLSQLNGQVHARAEFVNTFLKTSDLPWVPRLLADLHASVNSDATLDLSVPSTRTIERMVAGALSGGLYELADKRGGDQLVDNETGRRRDTSEKLVDEALARRGSAVSAKWVIRQVERDAEEQGVSLLGKSAMKSLVAKKLKSRGRTPGQMKSAGHHDDRTDYQSRRPWLPGMVVALDATQGDNFVRLTPDADPVRPWTHVAVEPATGVVIGVDASAFYREINVSMLLYDACRPLVVLPDPDGRRQPRIKGMPVAVLATEGVFKPGAIPARTRSDNIAQNHSRFMTGVMGLLGVDVSPSRPGRSTDNAFAEAAIGALRQFFEDADAYVGRHTAERGREVGKTDYVPTIDEYRSMLQQFAFFEHNHAPNAVPMYKKSGLSRLELWDLLISEHGAPPVLTDPNSWFCFLPERTVTRTNKGLAFKEHQYSCAELFDLPRHVVGPDRMIKFFADHRQEDCVWVPDPVEGIFYEIPNVIRDLTDAPLTREISKKARTMSGLRPTEGFHAAKAYAHAVEQIDREGLGGVKIQRSLADLRAAWGTYAEVRHAGAAIVGPSNSAAPRTDASAQASPAGPAVRPLGRTGPLQEPAPVDLDRPIQRKDT